MRFLTLALCGLIVVMITSNASAEKKKRKKNSNASCLHQLDQLGVKYKQVERRYIKIAVRVDSDLGGVTYRQFNKRPLIIDCSLVVSLAEAGRYLRGHGIEAATFSSAYHIRRIKGTRKLSKHAYGLAIDVHEYSGDAIGTLRLKDDYEQGLGDEIDCIGQPLTPGGTILRAIGCQMRRSGMFRFILDPDYDGSHYNHFHIEARPWADRDDFAVTKQ